MNKEVKKMRKDCLSKQKKKEIQESKRKQERRSIDKEEEINFFKVYEEKK